MATHQDDIMQESLHEFSEMQTWRAVFAQQWEEIAELADPPSRNTFYYGSFNWPGQKKTDRQVDATAMMACERFGAILDSLLTPRNMMWHNLLPDMDYLMKNRQVRLWFENTTRQLFKYRYAPIANFSAQNQGNTSRLAISALGACLLTVTKAQIVPRVCDTSRCRSGRCSCVKTTRASLTAIRGGIA